jgi:hypothetical protein
MTDNDEQLDRFRDAVERKMADSDAAARAERPVTATPPEVEGSGTQRSLTEKGRTQDAYSIRDKNSQKGKKTADKWNQ